MVSDDNVLLGLLVAAAAGAGILFARGAEEIGGRGTGIERAPVTEGDGSVSGSGVTFGNDTVQGVTEIGAGESRSLTAGQIGKVEDAFGGTSTAIGDFVASAREEGVATGTAGRLRSGMRFVTASSEETGEGVFVGEDTGPIFGGL